VSWAPGFRGGRQAVNWSGLFAVTVSPLELFVRGSAIFWLLFLIFRLVLRREIGAIGIGDVLVIVLIADASQNAMAGEYRSITDGVVLIATIVGWNYLFDWLAYRSSRLAKLLEPPPLLLVHHGRLQRANMRREFLSSDELFAKLREKGVDDIAMVKRAVMESDGEVSVIRYDGQPTAPQNQRAGTPA
jgi:uncharacterized membrane protein YcaP (DUF421 family)